MFWQAVFLQAAGSEERYMKQERARRTREQVLDAAAAEFAARGFAQTRLDAVVARTGMSKGALYGHFRSKEELARALLTHADLAWTALLANAEQTRQPPLAALERLTVGLAEQLRSDIRIRAALRLAAELPPDERGSNAPLGPIPNRMVQLAAQAQSARAIRSIYAPAAVVQLLLTAVLGTQALSMLHMDSELPCQIEDLWQLLCLAATGGGPGGEPDNRAMAGAEAVWGAPGDQEAAAPHTAVGVTEW
jgi:AcrR family transcriptional regulator